jgi:diphthine synthase
MTTGKLMFIGLGLYDENDISYKGLKAIQNADTVYAEFYTSKLTGTTKSKLEKKFGKKITVVTREETEKGDVILEAAQRKSVALLTCGDPMTATTHIDLRLRALEKNIATSIINGSSIVTAAPGLLGLQHYKFGRATTLSFPEKDYFPTSPYMVIKENVQRGLHTLVLLDVQVENDTYMTANQGMDLLLQMEEEYKEKVFTHDRVVCVVAQVGSLRPMVWAEQVRVLQQVDFGQPLHSMVIPGKLHFMETEALVKLAGLPEELGETLQKL